jgi:hypothetical protein
MLPNSFQAFATHGARYSVSVHAYSNLRMSARAEQSSFEPGAKLTFHATLSEYGVPVSKRAHGQVELTRPDGSVVVVPLSEGEPGVLEGATTAAHSGTYAARIMTKGVTLRGAPFTREQATTSAVWRGGDHPYAPPRGPPDDKGYRLLACLLSDRALGHQLRERLVKAGIDLDAVRKCLEMELRRGGATTVKH